MSEQAAESAGPLARALIRWVDWMNHSALLVVAVILLGCFVLFRYTVDNLGISTDTSDMLAPDLEFRQIYTDYQRAFPQFTDLMIVVVDADTPDLAREAATRLSGQLQSMPALFKSVYLPGGGEFFDRNALLYLDVDTLQETADRLIRGQAFLGSLAMKPDLPELLRLTGLALERSETDRSIQIEPMLREIEAALKAANEQRFYQTSWQQLFSDSPPAADDLRALILLQPRLDYSRLQPASEAMAAVRDTAQVLGLDENHGVSVRITGEVALAHEELQSASRGAALAGIMSLVLVGLVLGFGLGSWQLVLATIVTLLCGLVMTAGFATFAIGHLNLISVAFAVLYIGLAVDYAIHYCLRYRELRYEHNSRSGALRMAAGDIGGSLLICTITTAIGFYAFVPTSFTGVSELGLIAGTGMVIGLALSLSLLPALLSLLPAGRIGETIPVPVHARRNWLRIPAMHPRPVLIVSLLAACGALLSLPAVHFDANPIALRDPGSESVQTFNELLESTRNSPWNLNVLADGPDGARWLASELQRLPEVGDTVTLDSFIPDKQPQKLDIIQDLALLLGPLGTDQIHQEPVSADAGIAALRKFELVVERSAAELPDPLRKGLASELREFLRRIPEMGPERQTEEVLTLETSLLGSFHPLLKRLNAAMQTTGVTLDDLPTDLVRRWVDDQGRYRVNVASAVPLLAQSQLNAFVDAVRAIAPRATGAAIFNIESGRVVVTAFQQAMLSALGAIVLLLLILLPSKRDVVLVLLPLLLAALITAAGAVVTGISFNFANVIALPLLLGIGVDSAVHMVHRYRTALPADGDLLGSSTVRAIIVSALTTICSFGSLAFSPHPGAASMGKLLSIGMAATLLCMLALLPALLYQRNPLASPDRSGDLL